MFTDSQKVSSISVRKRERKLFWPVKTTSAKTFFENGTIKPATWDKRGLKI